jgi:AhpD family alkylhydroperoxidase
MDTRLSLQQVYSLQPAIPEHIIALQSAANAGLDMTLVYLAKIRASQMNGCAFCINLNTKDALKNGEQFQRLDQLADWKESSLFDAKEKAVLAWTEALTIIHEKGVSQEDYIAIREFFSEQEVVNLIAVITAINSWNRICIAANIR